jgi:hypothetical protein
MGYSTSTHKDINQGACCLLLRMYRFVVFSADKR